MRVAVVGSGIAGLAAAQALNGHAAVTLFEASDWFGGHAHTVDVTLPGPDGRPLTQGVDTGFLVFNERTYPGLIALFDALQVPSTRTEMSFSVQVRHPDASPALEWSGSSLGTVFAQRRNLLRPQFLRMLWDLLRFNRITTRIAQAHADIALVQPLGDFLAAHGFSQAFRDWYLLPMLGCIWSCPTEQMLRYPVGSLIRFCHNHGLIQVSGRPPWRTVTGGSRRYVERIVAQLSDARLRTPVQAVIRSGDGVRLRTEGGWEHFDQVVLATHSDQALALLADASPQERELLGAIRYQDNEAVLHTDAALLPARRATWAAWNYEHVAGAQASRVCLHYLINLLQPLPWAQPVIVSLNPVRAPDAARVLGRYAYAHPVFDGPALQAQARLQRLQGQARTWFAGAWMGYGFHEDGLKAGLSAARQLLAQAGASVGSTATLAAAP
ncbi:NAD(P)/FAD-dependent oxidoreductase [Ramlibacter rhizophilus]|uniref:NAD/FAD-binding protein n=1 Tax=Ramlibacter rhizophilus TaxID=1781167 RepID=A0A4Z0BHD8_9BURK|nr:FAD-dependent oxidoreductase [Ramlibacter rhizophilus]TFY97883.1 NAD/FAD-binding protein [Ramlibacter rhizophilus]